MIGAASSGIVYLGLVLSGLTARLGRACDPIPGPRPVPAAELLYRVDRDLNMLGRGHGREGAEVDAAPTFMVLNGLHVLMDSLAD